MASIQKLHDMLWSLSEVIWKTLNDYDFVKLREQIPDKLNNNWNWISYLFAYTDLDIDGVKKTIMSCVLYSQITDKIAEKHNLNHRAAESKVFNFVLGMMFRLVANNDQKFISQQITIFLNELEKNPVRFIISLLLYRILVKSNDINVNLYDNLSLEPKGEEEFPDIYLEGTVEGLDTENAVRNIQIIIDTLRLLGFAGIEVIDGNIFPDSFLQKSWNPDTILSDSPFTFEISKKGAIVLQNNFKVFHPLIVKARTHKNYSHIDIALQRYTDALVRRGPYEQRITYAITSLEALLLKPREREGLSRRLGQRLAILLGLIGSNPSNLYDAVLQAYDIRSTFIHGGKVEEEIDVEEICQKILSISRNCLISFLQVIDEKKDKIINLLDRAIVDDKMKKTLSEMMKDVKFLPVPS